MGGIVVLLMFLRGACYDIVVSLCWEAFGPWFAQLIIFRDSAVPL
jgi:hypothetical protein